MAALFDIAATTRAGEIKAPHASSLDKLGMRKLSMRTFM